MMVGSFEFMPWSPGEGDGGFPDSLILRGGMMRVIITGSSRAHGRLSAGRGMAETETENVSLFLDTGSGRYPY